MKLEVSKRNMKHGRKSCESCGGEGRMRISELQLSLLDQIASVKGKRALSGRDYSTLVLSEDLRRWSPVIFQKRLEKLVGESLSLRWNDNSNSILSVSRHRSKPRFRVSIHELFLDIPPSFFKTLSTFILSPTSEVRSEIRRYIFNNNDKIRTPRWQEDTTAIIPRGRYYNLAVLARRLNVKFFKNQLEYKITWGRTNSRVQKKGFLSIQLGSYNEKQNLIRVHPILDNPRVPMYFLAYVIYHEMLHIVCRPVMDRYGRVIYHTPEFRRLEVSFPDYKRAVLWEKDKLPRFCERH